MAKRKHNPEQILIIIKDCRTTDFMHTVGVFESFKFAGRIATIKGIKFDNISDLVERLCKEPDDCLQVVGVIVPGNTAVILPGHEVISDGKSWVRIADVCERYQAPLKTIPLKQGNLA
jgi:hypothetical protein